MVQNCSELFGTSLKADLNPGTNEYWFGLVLLLLQFGSGLNPNQTMATLVHVYFPITAPHCPCITFCY